MLGRGFWEGREGLCTSAQCTTIRQPPSQFGRGGDYRETIGTNIRNFQVDLSVCVQAKVSFVRVGAGIGFSLSSPESISVIQFPESGWEKRRGGCPRPSEQC